MTRLLPVSEDETVALIEATGTNRGAVNLAFGSRGAALVDPPRWILLRLAHMRGLALEPSLQAELDADLAAQVR